MYVGYHIASLFCRCHACMHHDHPYCDTIGYNTYPVYYFCPYRMWAPAFGGHSPTRRCLLVWDHTLVNYQSSRVSASRLIGCFLLCHPSSQDSYVAFRPLHS